MTNVMLKASTGYPDMLIDMGDGSWARRVVLAGELGLPSMPGAFFFSEDSSLLTNNSTITGASRDVMQTATATASTYAFFGASFTSDKAGTGYIDASTDNVNWSQVATQTLVTGPTIDLNIRIRFRYYRGRFTNTSGSTQTMFLFGTSFTRA